MYYHCIVFFDVQNLVLCLTRGLIQSMTLGFGTSKPFGPVLSCPEYIFTGPKVNLLNLT